MSSQGWVHDCAFSPSGNHLAFVSHDSTATIVNFGETSGNGDSLPLQTVIAYKGRPFTCCLFTTESQLIAAGYDFFPIRINEASGEWVSAAWHLCRCVVATLLAVCGRAFSSTVISCPSVCFQSVLRQPRGRDESQDEQKGQVGDGQVPKS